MPSSKTIRCPKCGSLNIIKHDFKSIQCKDCLKYSTIIHPIVNRPKYSSRPPCKWCGARKGVKHDARRYVCGVCGRTYVKDWQEKAEIDLAEVRTGVG